MAGRPNCIQCIHYFVTHNHAKPHGCRGLGFKSAHNPAAVVFASSGLECQLFVLKKKKNESGGSRGGIVA